MSGEAWQAKAWHGRDGKGADWQARLGVVRQGLERRGRPGPAWMGEAGTGQAWIGRLGWAGIGGARNGQAGKLYRSKTMNSDKRQLYLERMKSLEDSTGRLTVDAVIKDAMDPDSPFHSEFEWDQTKASYAHWRYQGRKLITSVFTIEQTDVSTVIAVHYHRDPACTDREQGYRSITALRSDEDAARAALCNAFKSAGDMLRRAREFAIALKMDKEVDTLINGVVELRNRAQATQ